MSGKGTVLVVDDDDSIRAFIKMSLRDKGYEVLTAEHGRAALEAVDHKPPRVILLEDLPGCWMN